MKRFCQFPHSLEREKWFYSKEAAVGAGVQHKFKCSIFLKSGAFQLLEELKKDKEADNKATVVTKENEPHCFGVHEDALPFFNQLIEKIEIYDSKTRNRVVGVTRFNDAAPSSYLIDFDINSSEPAFAYTYLRGHLFSSVMEGDEQLGGSDAKKAFSYYEEFMEAPYIGALPGDLIAEIHYKKACCAHVMGDFKTADVNFKTAISTIKTMMGIIGANPETASNKVLQEEFMYYHSIFHAIYCARYTYFLYSQEKYQEAIQNIIRFYDQDTEHNILFYAVERSILPSIMNQFMTDKNYLSVNFSAFSCYFLLKCFEKLEPKTQQWDEHAAQCLIQLEYLSHKYKEPILQEMVTDIIGAEAKAIIPVASSRQASTYDGSSSRMFRSSRKNLPEIEEYNKYNVCDCAFL